MEYLIVAVILYFILQTAGNLVYILRGGTTTSETQSSPPDHRWEGPSPHQQRDGITEHPTFWGEDVEDASWRDLDD